MTEEKGQRTKEKGDWSKNKGFLEILPWYVVRKRKALLMGVCYLGYEGKRQRLHKTSLVVKEKTFDKLCC